jgi:Ssp1 endopeptidase immunity protein Rap1a
MKPTVLLLAAVLALAGFPDRARAVDSARELVSACQELERGREGTGKDILIPGNRDALMCWGYMQAMQDLSVLVDQHGLRVIGSCPPEETTTLELIHSFLAYARTHAGELDGNAAAVMIKVLQVSSPCRR